MSTVIERRKRCRLASSGRTASASTTALTLAPAQNRTDVDFGYAALLTLGDLVFQDVDRNGLYNPAIDVAVPDGTTVVLHRADGSVVATTTTANGAYSFTGLVPGDYSVELPASLFVAGGPLDGWTATTATTDTADPNTDVNNDSNAVAGADGSVVSKVITLSASFNTTTRTVVGGEPGGLTNATLDLGLIKPVFPAIDLVKKVQALDANTGVWAVPLTTPVGVTSCA